MKSYVLGEVALKSLLAIIRESRNDDNALGVNKLHVSTKDRVERQKLNQVAALRHLVGFLVFKSILNHIKKYLVFCVRWDTFLANRVEHIIILRFLNKS